MGSTKSTCDWIWYPLFFPFQVFTMCTEVDTTCIPRLPYSLAPNHPIPKHDLSSLVI